MLSAMLFCHVLLCAAPQSQPAANGATVTAFEIVDLRQARLKGKDKSDRPQFSFNRPGMKLVLEVQGEDVAHSSQFGMFELVAATDDKGGKLKLDEEGLGFHDFCKEFAPIDREQMFLGEENPPKDLIRIELPFETPARNASAISVRGKLQLKRVETVDVVVPAKPGDVKDDQLEKLGVKVKIVKPEEDNAFAYEVTGKMDALLEGRLVDTRGKPIATSGSSTISDGETAHREISLEKSPPSDAKLKLTLIVKAANVPVTFELKDLKLP